jgi:hypothetical protein
MPYVPGFSNDIFISYSHLDDRSVEGPGWVSDFHQRLQIEVEEELGARVQIWRDRRIGPADDFARDLERQLRASAMLLAVLSPGYLNSAWCEGEPKDSPIPSGRRSSLSTRNAEPSKSPNVPSMRTRAGCGCCQRPGCLEFFEHRSRAVRHS